MKMPMILKVGFVGMYLIGGYIVMMDNAPARVCGLILLCLTILANKRKIWARIALTTVTGCLIAIGVLNVKVDTNIILGVAVLVAPLVLMWSKSSSEWFNAVEKAAKEA